MSCATSTALGALAGALWAFAVVTILVFLRGAHGPQPLDRGDLDHE